MSKLYESIPGLVEAIQWDGTVEQLQAFTGHEFSLYFKDPECRKAVIPIPAGSVTAREGQYITRESGGRFNVYDADLFEKRFVESQMQKL